MFYTPQPRLRSFVWEQQSVIGSLHDTVTWPCQSSKTVVAQNRWQKWKDHVKNMKVAKFEHPNVAEWVFMAAWMDLYGKYCWWTDLAHQQHFSIQIFVIFLQIQTHINTHSLMPGDSSFAIFASFDTLFSFLPSILYRDKVTWPCHAKRLFETSRLQVKPIVTFSLPALRVFLVLRHSTENCSTRSLHLALGRARAMSFAWNLILEQTFQAISCFSFK